MLARIEISNYIFIDKLNIDFSGRFCVITGESGSGKSMIVKALDALRTGKLKQENALDKNKDIKISAIFSVERNDYSQDLFDVLDKYEIELDEGEIFFERTLKSGKVNSYIQGSKKNSAIFNEIIDKLVIQNYQKSENKLLTKNFALNYLDSYLGINKEKSELYALQSEYKKLEKDIQTRKLEYEKNVNDKDYLQYAISEIQQADIKPNEDEEIRNKLKFIKEKSIIIQNVSNTYEILTSGIKNGLRQAEQNISFATKKDDKLNGIYERIGNLTYECDDISNSLRKYLDELSDSEYNEEELLDRQDLISKLKRKYGNGTIEKIFEFEAQAKQKVASIDDFDDELKFMQDKLQKLQDIIINKADDLHKKRSTGKKKCENEVVMLLKDLSMKDAEFEIMINRNEAIYSDSDAEFVVAINKGGAKSLLRDVASGGELSRIFLALATVLNTQSSECEIYDEIDSGLGGESAKKIGEFLERISTKKQIIAITHQALIAARGDCHIVVKKITSGNTTRVTAEIATGDKRDAELKRMLVGTNNISYDKDIVSILK